MSDGQRLYENERLCEECGEAFWGTAGAQCCSASCRSKRWRAKKAKARCVDLAEICEEVLRRRNESSAAYSKLLPRLFRQVSVELRRRGWDPIELLISAPEQPAAEVDGAPGGVEGVSPDRRRWLHPPEREIELLDQAISQRASSGHSTEWHRHRRTQLARLLQERK